MPFLLTFKRWLQGSQPHSLKLAWLCVQMGIHNLKSKLHNDQTLKSALPKLKPLEDSIDMLKLYSNKNQESSDVPWPTIKDKLPINSPKSISPRTNTDRTNTEFMNQLTKRTEDTYRKQNTNRNTQKQRFKHSKFWFYMKLIFRCDHGHWT